MAWAAVDPNGDIPMLAVGCSRSQYALCEQVPGMNYRKEDGIWRAPLSWPAWVALLTVWGSQPLQVQPALQQWGMDQWDQVQRRYALRYALDATDPDIIRRIAEIEDTGGHGSYLRPTQRGGAQWLALMGRAILEDPMGNGKTPQVIRALQLVQKVPALIIAPTSSIIEWGRMVRKWAPELSVRVIDGSADRRRKQLMDEPEVDIYIISWSVVRMHSRLAAYPGLAFVRCDEHGGSTGKTKAQCEVCEKELNDVRFSVVVADEAHRMQNARSKWTRAVWYLAFGAECFWAVTGTPTGDAIDKFWPLAHGVDPIGFPAKSRYLDLFAIKEYAWHRGADVLGLRPETERAFHVITQPLMRRIPREIARPEAPQRLETEFRWPAMSPSQAKAYRQLRKESLAELESTTVVPENTAVKFGRMCQLAAAGIETYDGEDARGFSKQQVKMVLPSNKVDDLTDFLEDHTGQLIVAMNSPQLVALCTARLAAMKITHCTITGGQNATQRDQAVQWFQDGQCQVILMTSRSGRESITLTASSTVLFLQPDPSFLVREQVIGRADRIGQQWPVRTVWSLSPGTVEERLYALSCEKEERADQITRDSDLMKWMIGDDTVNTRT